VVSLSGVYHIPPGYLTCTLGGTGDRAFRLDEMIPLRGMWKVPWPDCLDCPGIPIQSDVFLRVFGDDPLVREDASPIQHVRPGLPPFLIVCAEKDLPYLIGMATDFRAALECCGGEPWFLRVAGRNHNSICFRAITPDDPVISAMMDFIHTHSSERGHEWATDREQAPTMHRIAPER
jgi:hypothetical protein